MKTRNLRMYILGVLMAFAFSACGDDDNVKNVNQPPTKPVLKEPTNSAENVLLKPTFKWGEGIDPEKQEIVYEVWVSTDKMFSETKTKKGIDIKTREFTFSNYELERFTTYYWKVLAYDDKKLMTESDVASFKTIDVDLRINLLTPEDKAKLTTKNVEISWEVKRSPIYKEEVTYSVFFRNGSSEFSFPAKKGLTDTKYALNGLKGNGNYFWAVVALDSEGNEVAKSETFSFTTPNTPPTAPKLNEIPTQAQTEEGVDVTIEWNVSKDDDRIMKDGKLIAEKLTYDVYLSKDADFSDDEIKKQGIENTENKNKLNYIFTNLEFNTDYYAKVVVKDESGAVVDSNIISFTTKKKTEAGDFTVTKGTWTDTRDNKEYKTVTINGKTWLAENFAYLPYIEKADADNNKMICSVYGVDNPTDIASLKASENYTKYGVLYSGYAVKDIAPSGWHVATDDEWKELEKLSGMTDEEIKGTGYRNRGVTMHKFIQEAEPFDSAKAEQPTNEMKASVKYGGYLSSNYRGNIFKGVGQYTYFWTSSKYSKFGTTGLYYRAFSSKRKSVERNSKGEKYRMYIRLVKD